MKSLGSLHRIRYKGAINIVTEVDVQCEALIINGIKKYFPSHDIVAEEGSGKRQSSPFRWIIDPLDGTVNYAHGYPMFCVSIGLEVEGEITLGVIFDPNRNELFSAVKGKGAFLGEKRLHVSKTMNLKQSLLATGFAYNVQTSARNNLRHFADFIRGAQAVRRPGAAAIDLAWLACGRIDGFWELFLKPWDMAAGVLLVTEAGGTISAFDGSPYDLYGDEIVASNGHIHRAMIRMLQKHD